MARLGAKQRAELPDSAFAYIDSKGNRRLPINDEGHVRNALSRFNQVRFESAEARERAFRKLLSTAIGFGIAPVGFVAARVRDARAETRPNLPTGQVTFLMTDIEGSTPLIARMGEAYPELLESVRGLIGRAVAAHSGCEVDSRADEFFAAFPCAFDGFDAAVAIQRRIASESWSVPVRIRIGLHSGTPARTETGYVGLAVNAASRICNAGHGGQILVSSVVKDELADEIPEGASLVSLGVHHLNGLPEPIELFQVVSAGLVEKFPPLRTQGT